ncbi:alanine racemase [Actinospica robiniae]|uniref:alanine racemase n=1 Tax=Actinospica robiniae TaxID=304901 RepID=UPI00041AB8B6|nr:alanine racemase [Actinospica robiniae]
MPLTLYVDRRAWQAHHHKVVAERPGLVPVVKGNGYGFTLPVLAEAAAALGRSAGVDQLAVGTADEAVRVLGYFPHDLVLLEPFLPAAPWVELPDRVVRNAASVEAVRALAGRRMVIDCRSSLRRQGVAKSELAQVREALDGARPEGFALHLPIDRPGRAEPVREVFEWIRALTEAQLDVPVMYTSHLTAAELAQLGSLFPRTRFRVRSGTDIWLGDPAALEARATVLDALPVARGDRVGYRQGRLWHAGWVVVVSGGTVQGVGLEAPRLLRGLLPRAKELARCGLRASNRTLSPFSWQGRRQWFAEPPHMSVSMIYVPGPIEPPAPGSELVAQLRHTATHFDRVAIV